MDCYHIKNFQYFSTEYLNFRSSILCQLKKKTHQLNGTIYMAFSLISITLNQSPRQCTPNIINIPNTDAPI
jgi:hypothetical protein